MYFYDYLVVISNSHSHVIACIWILNLFMIHLVFSLHHLNQQTYMLLFVRNLKWGASFGELFAHDRIYLDAMTRYFCQKTTGRSFPTNTTLQRCHKVAGRLQQSCCNVVFRWIYGDKIVTLLQLFSNVAATLPQSCWKLIL